ncbi:equilibrative nucleotide transporter 3-like [Rutidosis leptorrhynchoides]|uniref:equilibrative nucleotide transporter 3-like n=1 Tax=Rutidosis leptorrhynchoides TaxID=125765 RepID=UPI003A99B3A3
MEAALVPGAMSVPNPLDKGITTKLVKLQGKKTAMFVCWLLGIGCLFPWNSMLTIEDYYVNLFRDYHPSRVLTLVYQPFAFIALAVLTYYEAKVNTRNRNLSGYILFFVGTVAVLVLDLATDGRGGMGTFVGLCVISAAFGLADANVQGGMVGDLSYMLPEFIQSFLAGLSASGAITSGLRLFTKGMFDSSQNGLRKGAILFFAICTVYELLCVVLYAFVFPKLPIMKYYRSKAVSEGCKTVSANLVAGDIHNEKGGIDSNNPERLTINQLLTENADYALDMFLIYLLSLSIFPGFLSEDTGKHNLGSWYTIVLIAMYNVWDLVGRYVPLINCLKLESRKGLVIAVLSRFLLIPSFYFTAKYADQGWMIFLTSFLGLSNGYLTVCVLTSAPKGYKGPEQNALGNILVLFQTGGIFAGVTSDWLWLIGKGW